MNPSQVLGFLGTGLVAMAYIPQIRHLIKEHCSAGISPQGVNPVVFGLRTLLDSRHHDSRSGLCFRPDRKPRGHLQSS